jgi:hypothetical protein
MPRVRWHVHCDSSSSMASLPPEGSKGPFDSTRACRWGTAGCLLGTVLLPALLWAAPTRAAELSEAAREPRQESPTERGDISSYLSLGVGGSNVGITLRGLFTIAKGSWFAAINAGYGDELRLFGGPSPGLEQKDLGVIAGLHLRGRYFIGSLGLGLAYVHSVNRGAFLRTEDGMSGSYSKYEELERSGIGIPIVAQVFFHLGPVGLGGMLFGNINTTLPSIGAAGALHLGSF